MYNRQRQKGTGCTHETYQQTDRDKKKLGVLTRCTSERQRDKKELGVLKRCTTDRQRQEGTGCIHEMYDRQTKTKRNWVYSRDVRQTGHVKLLLLFLLVFLLVAPTSFPAKRKPVHRNPFHVVTQC